MKLKKKRQPGSLELRAKQEHERWPKKGRREKLQLRGRMNNSKVRPHRGSLLKTNLPLNDENVSVRDKGQWLQKMGEAIYNSIIFRSKLVGEIHSN